MTNALNHEKERLEKALKKLEETAHKIGDSNEQKLAARINSELQALNDKLQAARDELTHQSAELVRVKDENRRLRENNKKIAEALGNSIKEIEEMVA